MELHQTNWALIKWQRQLLHITLGNNKLVKQVIDRFKNEKPITDEMAGGPKTTDPGTLLFHITLKINKLGNPGHPVVSLVNSHTTKFIDYHLQFVAK